MRAQELYSFIYLDLLFKIQQLVPVPATPAEHPPPLLYLQRSSELIFLVRCGGTCHGGRRGRLSSETAGPMTACFAEYHLASNKPIKKSLLIRQSGRFQVLYINKEFLLIQGKESYLKILHYL